MIKNTQNVFLKFMHFLKKIIYQWAFWAAVSSVFRSLSSFLIWIILPISLSLSDLERVSFVYALSFSTIGFLDFGGVSNVLLTKVSKGNRNVNSNNVISLLATFTIQISMFVIVSLLLLIYGFSYTELLSIHLPIFIYFVCWSTVKKFFESLTKTKSIFLIDILISIIHILLFYFLVNHLNNKIFLTLSISIVFISFYLIKLKFGFKDLKYLCVYLFYFIKKTSPLLLSSFLVMLIVLFERNIIDSGGSEKPYHYSLTILLQLSQLIIIPFQGLYNKIWSYEANNNNNNNKFINFILSIVILIGPISLISLSLFVPILYNVKIDIINISLAGLVGILALVVQLLTTKLGATNKFKSLGWFSLLSSFINFLLLLFVSFSLNTNEFNLNISVLSIILIKYLILSILQIIALLFILSKDLSINFSKKEFISIVLFFILTSIFLFEELNILMIIPVIIYYRYTLKVFGKTFKNYILNV